MRSNELRALRRLPAASMLPAGSRRAAPELRSLPDPNGMILGVLSMYKHMPCNPPGSHSLILSYKKVDFPVFRLS